MTTLKALSDFLNTIAPYNTQCSWDNSGLLVGDPAREISCVAFALDLTNDTFKQAVDCGADVLVTHHPVIFNPKRNLLFGDPVYALCRAGLAAISVHTPWDCAQGGVNDVLCDALRLTNVQGIASDETAVPMARIGDITPCDPKDFAKRCARALGTTVQLVEGRDTIRRVAVCGGAGMDFFFDALSLGTDAYLTGEAKHHELLLAADCGKTLVVGGHFATETLSMAALQTRVQTAFPALRTVLLRQQTPVCFISEEG